MGIGFTCDAVYAEAVEPPAGERPLQEAIEPDADEPQAFVNRAVGAGVGREQGLQHPLEPAAEQRIQRRDQKCRGKQYGGTAEQEQEIALPVRPVAPDQVGGGQIRQQQPSLSRAREQHERGEQQDGKRFIPAPVLREPVDGDRVPDAQNHGQIVRVDARIRAQPVGKQRGALAKKDVG